MPARRADSVVALLVVVAAWASPAQANYFFDDFDGPAFDETRWNSSLATSGVRWCSSTVAGHHSAPGTWQDVAAEPCHERLSTAPYGAVVFQGGAVSCSAPAGQLAFPYFWAGPPSRPSPFPPSGDFSLELRLRVDSGQVNGTGLIAVNWANTEPVGDNPPVPGGEYLLSVWAEAGNCFVLAGGQRRDLGTLSGFHTFRFQYLGGEYRVFLDDVLALGPVASASRPNTLLVGNPVLAFWGDSDWSDFSLDYVRVEAIGDTPTRETTWGRLKIRYR